MDIGPEGRELLRWILIIAGFVMIVTPFVIHYCAKHWLRSFFRQKIEQHGYTPRDVREELYAIPLSRQYWQVRWLCRRSQGAYSPYDLKNFLKAFSYENFGRSSNNPRNGHR